VTGEDDVPPDALGAAVGAVRRATIELVRGYHRLEISGDLTAPEQPVLFVANHGFGGVFDLNVAAVMAALEDMQLDRPVTCLTHQMAWTLGVGRLLEPLGARPAGREVALEAFAAEHHVVVLPGGDLDAFKSFADRNRIVFGGRTGFARLAVEAGVDIVPIVTAGAGESAYVISDGQGLARALRLDKVLRAKAIPISLSLPWGLSVGGAGVLPYLPLPTKLTTAVLPPMRADDGESSADFAARVEAAMQESLTTMAAARRRRPASDGACAGTPRSGRSPRSASARRAASPAGSGRARTS
jgi:1-acyl-sn-glycerol-3-phosphate acyltransferase